MKNAKLRLFLMFFSFIASFISAQSLQPKTIKQLFKARDFGALTWQFQQNAINIDESSIDNQTPLITACKNLDAEMADFLLNKGANPNLFNPLGATLRAIIDQYKEPNEPPATPVLPTFPKASDIERIFEVLIQHGTNPLLHKNDNLKPLNELISAGKTIHYITFKNPIIIALRKILPVFLAYKASQSASGDTKIITTCLESIEALYKQFPNKNIFDPLNTPLVKNGQGLLGKTPVLLAAENGNIYCLKAMLALKDIKNTPRINFVTAYTALKSARDGKKGFTLWGQESCKDILENFLQKHFMVNKKYSSAIIQTAQSTIARMAWQQQELGTDIYNNAITEAISKYTQRQFTKD